MISAIGSSFEEQTKKQKQKHTQDQNQRNKKQLGEKALDSANVKVGERAPVDFRRATCRKSGYQTIESQKNRQLEEKLQFLDSLQAKKARRRREDIGYEQRGSLWWRKKKSLACSRRDLDSDLDNASGESRRFFGVGAKQSGSLAGIGTETASKITTAAQSSYLQISLVSPPTCNILRTSKSTGFDIASGRSRYCSKCWHSERVYLVPEVKEAALSRKLLRIEIVQILAENETTTTTRLELTLFNSNLHRATLVLKAERSKPEDRFSRQQQQNLLSKAPFAPLARSKRSGISAEDTAPAAEPVQVSRRLNWSGLRLNWKTPLGNGIAFCRFSVNKITLKAAVKRRSRRGRASCQLQRHHNHRKQACRITQIDGAHEIARRKSVCSVDCHMERRRLGRGDVSSGAIKLDSDRFWWRLIGAEKLQVKEEEEEAQIQVNSSASRCGQPAKRASINIYNIVVRSPSRCCCCCCCWCRLPVKMVNLGFDSAQVRTCQCFGCFPETLVKILPADLSARRCYGRAKQQREPKSPQSRHKCKALLMMIDASCDVIDFGGEPAGKSLRGGNARSLEWAKFASLADSSGKLGRVCPRTNPPASSLASAVSARRPINQVGRKVAARLGLGELANKSKSATATTSNNNSNNRNRNRRPKGSSEFKTAALALLLACCYLASTCAPVAAASAAKLGPFVDAQASPLGRRDWPEVAASNKRPARWAPGPLQGDNGLDEAAGNGSHQDSDNAAIRWRADNIRRRQYPADLQHLQHLQQEQPTPPQQPNTLTPHPPGYRWPFLGLVGFMLVGATGNILVCMAIWRERRLQTATNYFLLSLALADLLVCTLVMPFGIVYEFFGKYFAAN